jgi:hypothetical protein
MGSDCLIIVFYIRMALLPGIFCVLSPMMRCLIFIPGANLETQVLSQCCPGDWGVREMRMRLCPRRCGRPC